MPYSSNKYLPQAVQEHLPTQAQDIYREAFNHAWEQYDAPEKRKQGGTREEAAHRVAWAAVKKKYHKEGEDWVENGSTKQIS